MCILMRFILLLTGLFDGFMGNVVNFIVGSTRANVLDDAVVQRSVFI